MLKYIGPDILGAKVQFGPIGKDGQPVIYDPVDLSSGVTVLSSPAQNGWTIDSTALGKADLGANLKTYINGVKEEIHTSCSTPFVSGAPAPLNKPIKGDPSPNWFVVDFQQK